jgi:hypothetical protein
MLGEMRCLLLFFVVSVFLGCGTNDPGSREAASTEPFGGDPHDIPGLIEAEHYDEGDPGEAYDDNDEINHGVDYRGPTHVDIEERPDASNGHGIGWATAGEWLVYTVQVEQTGHYTVRFPVASDGEGGTFHLEMDGEDITGPLRIPDTGGWDQLEMIQREGIELEAGTYTLRLMMDTDGETGGVGDIDYMHFVRTQ